jgi:hypothetical protein
MLIFKAIVRAGRGKKKEKKKKKRGSQRKKTAKHLRVLNTDNPTKAEALSSQS